MLWLQNEIHCLADKMKGIKYAKQNSSASTRTKAKLFNCTCGRTQLQTILKSQDSITHDYEMNAPTAR